MARSIDSDFFHNFRFHVVDPAGGNLDPVAGFTKVTIPNITLESVPYREGVYKFTRKFPGIPTVGDCQLTKGVVKKKSDFYKWLLKPINGRQDYRSDLLILEYHISDEFGINGSPSRTIRIKEVFPVEFKPASDLDAVQNDIAVTDLKLSVEEFDVDIISA